MPVMGQADVTRTIARAAPSRALDAAQAMRCFRICSARRHAPLDEIPDLIHRVEGLVLSCFRRQTRRVRSGDYVGAPRQRERGHLVLRAANVKGSARDALVV